MKKFKVILLLPVLLCIYVNLYSETTIKNKQTPVIDKIIERQDNKNTFSDIAEIINYIDGIYGNLYDSLENGGKITLYFGPAHGKDDTERWRGITTNRVGITGLPEEYYSRLYSRKLYNLLKQNSFLNIVAKDEYLQVLEGKSDTYHYMKFKDVLSNAKNAGAFMVVEMHMNNVSIFEKADGLVNMPGIHMARDSSGRKLLINITSSYSGFLTLYNKYDAGGFSKQYALNIRDSLVTKGYKANSWDYGAVADDRFSYYLNFPVSVIYECGFISHPVEEKKLLEADYMDGMVKTQYEMLLKTFNDIYGIDISKNEFRGKRKDFKAGIEILKLARLAIYFIQHADTKNANMAVKAMNDSYYNSQTKDSINYYRSIMNTINQAENYYLKGTKYRNKKKFNKARTCFVNAKESLNRNEMYSAYKEKYSIAIYGNKKIRSYIAKDNTPTPNTNWEKKRVETAIPVKASQITKPFILALSTGENLENAVIESLNPDSKSLKSIIESMNNYKKVSLTKVRKYSSKKHKYTTVYKKKFDDFEFKPGIFVVQIDRNMRIVKADRVSQIYLDPNKYQNQQYLKNSYFTEIEQERNL
ncbi:MAG TPA: N-acetylmuramoyl-L-alanine amidase [Spirochaetota bacterium]|nr:N-acetylmuramoyl-L-alanine amidase [Spirochaetota bacterium]HPS85369.1 N-acetylmuramoyl-L-alanine amidase [Spirochaetota bacterium]